MNLGSNWRYQSSDVDCLWRRRPRKRKKRKLSFIKIWIAKLRQRVTKKRESGPDDEQGNRK